jgi:hypothetical protein
VSCGSDKTDKERGRQRDKEKGETRKLGEETDWGDGEIKGELNLPVDVLRSMQEG